MQLQPELTKVLLVVACRYHYNPSLQPFSLVFLDTFEFSRQLVYDTREASIRQARGKKWSLLANLPDQLHPVAGFGCHANWACATCLTCTTSHVFLQLQVKSEVDFMLELISHVSLALSISISMLWPWIWLCSSSLDLSWFCTTHSDLFDTMEIALTEGELKHS